MKCQNLPGCLFTTLCVVYIQQRSYITQHFYIIKWSLAFITCESFLIKFYSNSTKSQITGGFCLSPWCDFRGTFWKYLFICRRAHLRDFLCFYMCLCVCGCWCALTKSGSWGVIFSFFSVPRSQKVSPSPLREYISLGSGWMCLDGLGAAWKDTNNSKRWVDGQNLLGLSCVGLDTPHSWNKTIMADAWTESVEDGSLWKPYSSV